jgi:hypothetical protein
VYCYLVLRLASVWGLVLILLGSVLVVQCVVVSLVGFRFFVFLVFRGQDIWFGMMGLGLRLQVPGCKV